MLSGLIRLLGSTGIPRDIMISATFYPVACLTALFAILVVTSRNVFHSAVYLAFTLMGVACVYLYLGAEFLAIIQILIYVGAIVTLFIFTIMLTADINMRPLRGMIGGTLIAALACFAIFFVLVKVIVSIGRQSAVTVDSTINLPQLGRSLMSIYVLPFEVMSLLLLAALAGAIVIGKREKI